MSELSRHTPPGADVRGFYARLGVELPGWCQREAPAHCFAAPEAHARADRAASCSVNLASGAWFCHGCGASGGAYDAALAFGHRARSAIDLMIDFGLAERRNGRRSPPAAVRRAQWRSVADTPTPGRHPEPAVLAVDGDQVAAWQAALLDDTGLLGRLARERGWSAAVLERLAVGVDDRARITIPVYGGGRLVALARYLPPFVRFTRARVPKLRMDAGSRRALFPSPAAVDAGEVWIVEGHPDAIAAHSAGIAALAVPGDWGWDPSWAPLLAGRDVVVCLDCDTAGRRAATAISADLALTSRSLRRLDLDPARHDGYDLTDALLEHAADELRRRVSALEPIARDDGR